MDLTLQVPMQYCSQQHDFTFTIRHIHSWALFLLWPASSFLLELILLSSPVAYWTPANLGGSSFSVIFFAFSYFSWSSQSKNAGVICQSLLQWTTFCQNSPPRPVHLALHGKAQSFVGLDKAVIHMISLVSFL